MKESISHISLFVGSGFVASLLTFAGVMAFWNRVSRAILPVAVGTAGVVATIVSSVGHYSIYRSGTGQHQDAMMLGISIGGLAAVSVVMLSRWLERRIRSDLQHWSVIRAGDTQEFNLTISKSTIKK